MTVFSRFALRSLSRSRTRTVVSIIGIALSCALICAVLTTVVSMSDMLCRRTAIDEGAWQVEAPSITAEALSGLEGDARVRDHIEVTELGAVELGEANAADFGQWLFVKTWPQNPADEEILPAPEITSGRAPRAAGEVVLPHYLEGANLEPCGIEASGPLEVGSGISMQLGTRTVTLLGSDHDPTEQAIDGTSRSGAYFDEAEATQSFTADLGRLDLTVVGFYRAYGYSGTRALQGNSAYVSATGGEAAAALADDSPATCVFSLITVWNPNDAPALADELSHAATDSTGKATTHNALLRWQGVTGGSEIWNTLYQIAAVLSAVIVIAGVSLVYNSFAISVAERTKMFGLLASLGASRRQLRRCVLTEALILAVIGIPIGIVLGMAGCYAVFQLTGTGLAAMFDVDAYGMSVQVSASPAAIGIAALLALVTVLISAWVPARRASRVSAVDAIRQTQDVKLGRQARLRRRRGTTAGMGTGVRPHDLAYRICGVPGFIAHRNLARASSKGRVTVAALGISVALLIIAGIIGETLGYASGTALDTAGSIDLSVRIDATNADTGSGPLLRDDGNVNGAALQDTLARLDADARALDGAESMGYHTSYVSDIVVPTDMVSDASWGFFGVLLADGSWSGPVYVDFIDDATWSSYVASLGLDAAQFEDPAHPRAIALNEYDRSEGGTYGSYSPLAGPGAIDALTFDSKDGLFVGGVVSDDAGNPCVWYSAPDGSEQMVPLDEAVANRDAIEVGALADRAPAGITTHTSTLHILLPASAIALAENMGFADAQMDFTTAGDAAAASRFEDAFDDVAASFPELDCQYNNTAQTKQQTRMMSETVQTFIYCFTAICGLIAVANVFNTLTNSLILRRHEFAVLRSIGMGARSFRRMIAYECASYALRGLVLGIVLAGAVDLAIAAAMSSSFTTFTPVVPWANLLAAAALVIVVILISVAYALQVNRASSIVDALREEAI